MVREPLIFLGGTCNESKWREIFKTSVAPLKCFDPTVDDWNDEAVAKEEQAKKDSTTLLYVITERGSFYSAIEVTDDSNKYPDKTILCFYDENNNFTEADIKSFNNAAKKIKANGARVFFSLEECIEYVNNLYKVTSASVINEFMSSTGFNVPNHDRTEYKKLTDRINELIQLLPNAKQISDGHHTFYDLYDHRGALFAVVCALSSNIAWKSKNHHPEGDDMFDDMFIVGIDTRFGQITYHYHLDKWNHFHCKELEHAPKWDGHTSEMCVKRLLDYSNDVSRNQNYI